MKPPAQPEVGVKRDTFHGSSLAELQALGSGQRVAALGSQAGFFAHRGDLLLTSTTLTLSDWMHLSPNDIDRVDQHFVPGYGRFQAAGTRGGFPSLGVLGKAGMPLVLTLTSGSPLVLLVGLSRVWGTTHNASWLGALRAFAGTTP